MTEKILICDNVGMRYGSGPEILHDISFHMEEKDFCFLTGPSGAGKSSLLKLFFLAEKPSRGLINLFGQDMAVLPRKNLPLIRRRIGVVFQEFHLLDHLTIYENVALTLRARNLKRSNYESDVLELLEWVGLSEKRNSFPPTLSGGQKQRAAIARAVVGTPDLLIADEPTGSIDPEGAARILHLFCEMNRMGTSVILTTHSPDLISSIEEKISVRALRLQEGVLSDG